MGSRSVGFDGGGCSHARNRITHGAGPEQAVFVLDDGDGIAWRKAITEPARGDPLGRRSWRKPLDVAEPPEV